MAKKIVINNDMVKQTKAHLVSLFKPTNNPFNDRSVAQGGTNLNQFALQYYPGRNSKDIVPTTAQLADNPVGTMYNNKNIVTNLFLCTENFITFIDRINNVWAADTMSRVLTKVTYNKNAVTGFITAGTVDTSARSVILPLVQGPTTNKATHFAHYEDHAAGGLWAPATGKYGVGSTSVQELFLRYLYSIDAEKRNVAFQIAELYYGITNSECVAANTGFIPAKDFNSNLFDIKESNDEITLDYPKPIEFYPHYDETIHNPLNKKLYLYFPFITTNGQRPGAVRAEDDNGHEGYISIYTGVTPTYYSQTFLLTNTDPATAYANNSYASVDPQVAGVNPSYGDYTPNPDMPVLTNSIWSKAGNKWVNQAGYTAIHITETGAGGDVTFDHTDKIDFIDSLKFIIKAPRVFS